MNRPAGRSVFFNHADYLGALIRNEIFKEVVFVEGEFVADAHKLIQTDPFDRAEHRCVIEYAAALADERSTACLHRARVQAEEGQNDAVLHVHDPETVRPLKHDASFCGDGENFIFQLSSFLTQFSLESRGNGG